MSSIELAVEFGVGAFGDEIKFLLQLDRKFAHEPGRLAKSRSDGLHPGAHHGVLQIRRQAGEALQRCLDDRIVLMAGDLEELIAGQHQFGDEEHDPLQRADGDADGLRPRLLRGRMNGRRPASPVCGAGLVALCFGRRDSSRCRRGFLRLLRRNRGIGMGLQSGDQVVVVARGLLSRFGEARRE